MRSRLFSFRSGFFGLVMSVVSGVAGVNGLAGSARAEGLPEQFTLGKYVPADAWMYIHSVHNPERAWIDAEWDKVWTALCESGIDKDVAKLAEPFLSEEARSDIQHAIEKTTMLAKGVRWCELVQKEFVFAERLAAGGTEFRGMNFDYIVLTRGAPDAVEANATGLLAILQEIVKLGPSLGLVESKRGNVMTWSLTLKTKTWSLAPNAPTGEAAKPQSILTLLRFEDVVGLVVSPPTGPANSANALDDVVAFMNKESKKPPMTGAARFKEAIAQVKPPTDECMYFDFHGFVGSMDRLFAGVAKEEKGDETERQAMRAVSKLIELANIVDYSVTSVRTKGRQELKDEAVRFQPGKEKSPIAQMILQRKAFDRFDQFIPEDAKGFDLSGGVDLEKLYQIAIEFVEQNLPDGKGLIEKWKGLLAGVDFDPQRDVFSWFSGEMISMELPAAVVTPMGNTDNVLMIRVKDSEIATKKVNGAIDFFSALMQGQGQALSISPADVQGHPFRQITHPMMAMFLRPLVGVNGDWLIIATSTGAVNKCLDVAAGKTASVSKNERFVREGLVPKGAVHAASFRDTSQFGNELGGGAAMAGMIGGMAAAGMGKEVPTEVKTAIQSALGIVMKLGPVLQKIDFYSSEASMTTYDGERTLRTESVTTYKQPAATEAKTANAAEPTK